MKGKKGGRLIKGRKEQEGEGRRRRRRRKRSWGGRR